MGINRKYIGDIANSTREILELNTPIDLESLCAVIENKLCGKCVPVDSRKLEVDAEIKTPDTVAEADCLFTINYRIDRPKTRVLFSIAHELGHLILHLLQKDGKLVPSATMQRGMMSSESELSANEFAAALLMPENDFIIQCENYTYENELNITQLASYFNVSIQAATVRGNVMGLW